MLGGCPTCVGEGRLGILSPVYAYDAADAEAVLGSRCRSMLDYHRLLPLSDASSTVSLGEGGTPLINLPAIAATVGATSVWAKCEGANPTHSWKDRTNSIAISVGKYFAFDKVVCTSTGNHGVSMAAYAARAGMHGLVLLSEGAPANIRSLIQSYGSNCVTFAGSVLELMTTLWRDDGWYIAQRNAPGMNGRPFGNPFGVEGYKTIAYEIYHQLGGKVPDRVYVPTSGGDGIWGIYKGFYELELLGLANHIPKVIACQSAAAAPLVSAIQHGLLHVEPIETQPTIALSLLDPQSGDLALLAVNRSLGTAIAVTDEEILDAIEEMARLGLSVEPASAAPLAALAKQARGGTDLQRQSVVLIASGSGERWPATYTRIAGRLPETSASVSDLRTMLQQPMSDSRRQLRAYSASMKPGVR